MENNSMPKSPTGSRFGWPKPGRIEEFRKLSQAEKLPTARVVFRGQTLDLPMIRVPIELPKYRLANGRTVSLQAEFLARNEGYPKDFFGKDPEIWEAQEMQHKLLLDLSTKSDLQQFFKDPAHKQIQEVLLDEYGFIVNGNRRMATWRELLFQEGATYGHFRIVDVAVLPHGTEQEIDRLEAMLQIEQDIKADYTWDAEANMMLVKQKQYGLSVKDLAELYGKKESGVQELLDMQAYADEYLRSRGNPELWSQISEHEFAFKQVVAARPKIVDIGDQELFKQSAFAMIDDPSDAGGRLYDQIPAIVQSLGIIRDKLEAEFKIDIPELDKSLGELFGEASSSNKQAASISLAKEIQKPENTKKTREIIGDVIETQKQLKRDSKKADFLLDSCARAHALLAAAVKDGLRSESKISGVEKQLAELDIHIDLIRKFLAEHAED